jgi:aminoglycoside 6'-N-acetyltransferase
MCCTLRATRVLVKGYRRTMPDVDLRPLTRDDYWLLSTWLREPLVRRWWADDPSLSGLEEQYGASIDGTDAAHPLIASVEGTPFGLIQWYFYRDEAEYVAELGGAVELPEDATSIDYLIGSPEFRGRGLALAMVAAVLAPIREAGSRTVVVPVHADNESSWGMLARAGFHLVGEADLEPDNPEDDRRHVVYRLDL